MKPVQLTCALGLAAVCAACGPSAATPDVTSDTEKPSHPDGEGLAVQVEGAANAKQILSPTDATPDPDGETVYYVATIDGPQGRLGGVFRARADGSDIETLSAGAPLSAPVGIAISTDGKTLFVADIAATTDGALLRGSTQGGASSFAPMVGTEGLFPRAVTVARVGKREQVYFTGQTRDDATPALYRIGVDGNDVELVASGAPMRAPAGVAVTREGIAYLIDALADDGAAALIRVKDGKAEALVGGLGVGFPAGITLDLAEATALVSGLAPETGRDVVYVVDLASMALSTITDPVDAFAEPAGLHRAHNRNVFAWADSEANDTGTVFVLSL